MRDSGCGREKFPGSCADTHRCPRISEDGAGRTAGIRSFCPGSREHPPQEVAPGPDEKEAPGFPSLVGGERHGLVVVEANGCREWAGDTAEAWMTQEQLAEAADVTPAYP